MDNSTIQLHLAMDNSTIQFHLAMDNSTIQLHLAIDNSTIQLHLAMEESKNTYYSNLSRKLVKQKSNPKTNWSVLKRFLNDKKIPCIPSLFHENKLVTNFREKD